MGVYGTDHYYAVDQAPYLKPRPTRAAPLPAFGHGRAFTLAAAGLAFSCAENSPSVRLCLFGADGIGCCGASVIIHLFHVQFNEMEPASKDPVYLAKAVRLAVAYNPHSPTS